MVSFQIELRLNESSEFDLLNPERVTWMCICGNEAKRHDYVIVPRNIGFINITAQVITIVTLFSYVNLTFVTIWIPAATPDYLIDQFKSFILKKVRYGRPFC